VKYLKKLSTEALVGFDLIFFKKKKGSKKTKEKKTRVMASFFCFFVFFFYLAHGRGFISISRNTSTYSISYSLRGGRIAPRSTDDRSRQNSLLPHFCEISSEKRGRPHYASGVQWFRCGCGVLDQDGPCSRNSVLANNGRVMACDSSGDPQTKREREKLACHGLQPSK